MTESERPQSPRFDTTPKSPRYAPHRVIPIPRPRHHNYTYFMEMVGPVGLESTTKGWWVPVSPPGLRSGRGQWRRRSIPVTLWPTRWLSVSWPPRCRPMGALSWRIWMAPRDGRIWALGDGSEAIACRAAQESVGIFNKVLL